MVYPITVYGEEGAVGVARQGNKEREGSKEVDKSLLMKGSWEEKKRI